MRGLITGLLILAVIALAGAGLVDGATAAIGIGILLLVGLGPARLLRLIVGAIMMARSLGF